MNTLIEYFVPQWVSIAFLVAIPLPFVLIAAFVKKEAQKLANRKAFPVVLLFFVVYMAYVVVASLNGWFNAVMFPPKVLLLTTFPYAFLLFGVVMKTKLFEQIVAKASLASLVQLHIFRVIGVFFVLLAFYDALPKPFALIAGFGDVITAITSIFVVRALAQQKGNAAKWVRVWNWFGAIDILFTAIAANALTKISIDTGAMGVDSLAFFPFCIIPAFAPPTILLLHYVIHQKIKATFP